MNENSQIVVSIADLKVAKGPGIKIVTHALGSCIGMAIWDMEAQVGGILHYMLPESNINPERAKQQPDMFADTGIPRLFKQAYKLGADKRRIIVKLAGGANVMDKGGHFNIGKRNYLAARKMLFRNGVLIKGEMVGGNSALTMRMDLTDGTVSVHPSGQEGVVI